MEVDGFFSVIPVIAPALIRRRHPGVITWCVKDEDGCRLEFILSRVEGPA